MGWLLSSIAISFGSSGSRARASATSVQPMATQPPSAAPWPNASRLNGTPSTRKPTAAGTRKVKARRRVRVVSAATPGMSWAAASREALGSIAVASDTVSREWGSSQTR